MAFEQRELSGSMFKNDKKTLPNHPDYRGDCKVDGKLYWMSGWIKETKAGAKFLSVSLTLKDEAVRPTTLPTFDDDDMPF
jgi:uncharacterized protein (DUF736 family)